MSWPALSQQEKGQFTLKKKKLESNILETGLCNMNTSNTFHNIKTAITGKC